MADTTEKKTYLINVESNLNKYAIEAAKAKEKVDQLTAANKEMKVSGTASAIEIEVSNAKLRDAQKEYTQAKKLVDLQTQANNSNANSRKQLSAIVALEQQRLGSLANQYTINANGQRVLSQEYILAVKNLKNAKDAVIQYDKAQSDGRSSIGLYSEAIEGALGKFEMMPGKVGMAATAVKGFGASLKTLAANPVGAIIMVIVAAVTALIGIFKKFTPVMEAVERIMSGIKAVFQGFGSAIIGLITGTQTLGETFRNLGKDIKQAYDEGVKWRQLEQDLFELTTENAVLDAQRKRQIDELLIQSKNRARSEEERMGMITQALLLEEVALGERMKIADKEVEQAKFKMIMGKNLTKAEMDELDKRGVVYANELKMRKKLTEEDIKAYSDALVNQQTTLNASLNLQERAMARQDLLADKAEAKKLKREEAEQKRIDEKKKQELDAYKEADDFVKKEIERMDKEAEDKFNAELDFQHTLSEQRRKEGQAEWDARIEQEKALAEAVLEIKQQLADSEIRLAESVLDLLSGIAGKSKALQNISLIAERAYAIANVIIKTTQANNAIRTTAAMSVLPGPGYLARLALAMGKTAIPINLNRAAAVIEIAAIMASTISALKKSSEGSASGGSLGEEATGVIASSPSAKMAYAPSVGATFLSQPQLTQSQLNAIPNQNLLTAEQIAIALSKLPAPVVTVEDINAKIASGKKIEVRATI